MPVITPLNGFLAALAVAAVGVIAYAMRKALAAFYDYLGRDGESF